MRRLVLVLTLMLLCLVPAWAQAPGEPAASPKAGKAAAPGSNSSVVLLQSEIAGSIKNGTAVIVRSTTQDSTIVTSYEAIKGAATIHVLVPDHGLVDALILKFAPEANLALLSIPVPNLQAAKVGDSDLLRAKTPITMTSAVAIKEGNIASAMSTVTRSGVVQTLVPRPTGPVLRLNFMPPTTDESTGAAITIPSSGQIVAIALSYELSQIDTLRFAIPLNLMGALDSTLVTSEQVLAIKVLDGAQAPVYEVDPALAENQEGDSEVMAYVITIVVAIVVVAVVAFFLLRKKKAKIVPFSILPKLPDGQMLAFVTADGNLLPMQLDVIKVGRAADNDWHFDEPSVSNYHAKIKKVRGSNGWEVEDLRSTNGTCVRERKIGSGSTETIHPGTVVQFGKNIKVMLMTRNQSNQ